jgi:WXG100 family type VII secretion target
MVQVSTDITTVADTLTDEFSRLMRDLEPLMTAWQGMGGSGFQNVRAKVDEQLGHLNISLRSLAEAMKSAGTDYTLTDEELRTAMQEVHASGEAIRTAELFNFDDAKGSS